MAKKSKEPTGLHKIDIDWAEFEKLCSFQCTAEEIAHWFKCSVDTIERRVAERYNTTYADIRVQKQSLGKVSLRRSLFQLGLRGNLGALIWLSKQHLGFADKMEQKLETKENKESLIEKLSGQLAALKAVE